MDDDDAIIGLGLVLVGIGLIIFGLIIAAVVWFIISAIIAYFQYQKHLKEAEEEFDEVARDLGVDLPVDETLRAIGIDVHEEGDFDTVAEILAYGIFLGVDDS